MTSKSERLKQQYGQNIADSLGSFGGAQPSPVPASTTPDRYSGRSKGHGGEMLIGNIVPDPDQPRKEFDQAELESLAGTLGSHGQLQPIRVRWSQSVGKWIIIEGERRWRAAQIAGLTRLACVFVESDVTEDIRLEEQLLANCMRSDLRPMERAQAFRRLADLKGWSGAQIADRLHLDRTTVTRSLQLLELPDAIKDDVIAGTIGQAAAVELTKLDDPAEQAEVADRIKTQKLSRDDAAEAVRQKRTARPESASKVVALQATDCTVTLRFRQPPSPEQVSAALREVLGEWEQRRAAS